MKIRTGFVSNSSSSSFIIDGDEYSVDQIRKIIELGIKIEEVVGEYRKYVPDRKLPTLKQTCRISEAPNCDKFIRRIEKYQGIGTEFETPEMREACKEETMYTRNRMGRRKCIIVDSVRDNSIPWRIQEVLETIAVHRTHFG
jgi:hypothetical protein